MEVLEIKEEEFDSKIKEGKVLVDCYAPWCGPCRMLSPIIDQLANEVDDYSFFKLNVDDAEGIAKRYGIMSIPTILIFDNGSLKKQSVGFMGKDEILELIGGINDV